MQETPSEGSKQFETALVCALCASDGKPRRNLVQRARTVGIDATASALNWVCDHIVTASSEIRWQDHLRWWLETQLSKVFAFFYAGSDEEVQAVYGGEVPPKYMSDRQRAVLTLPPSEYGVHCAECRWDGWYDEAEDDGCPECGHGVYLDPFDPPRAATGGKLA